MKICHVVFSTNRLNYLKRTFESQKKFDFTGLNVHKLFIDDYPLTRNDSQITDFVKSYGYDEIILHKENKGITSTWNELFEIVKDRNYDYILHQEDDVELMYDIKVADLIEILKTDNTLSQVQLKRNAWYNHEKDINNITENEIYYKKYVYEKRNDFFWMLTSLYPSWITKIDFVKETGFCPSESVIADYLYNTKGLSSAILKKIDGSNLVSHIGDFSQGKRVNEGEPGWNKFSMYDPNKKYCSRTGAEWDAN